MKNSTTAALLFAILLPFQGFAKTASATDTLGTKISRTQKTVQTKTYIEKSMDSIVDVDLVSGLKTKVPVVTYDTVESTETTETTETEYIFASKPETFWKLGSEFSVGVNQVAFSNWAEGGVPSWSILLANKSFAQYRKGASVWKTDFEIKYGLQQQGDDPWYKNNDQIKLYSSYGFAASSHWNYSMLLDFKTQITKGYSSATADKDAFVSRFLSPMYLTYSIGMEYENVDKTASIFLMPVAYNLTYVLDTSLSTKYGISQGNHELSRFGPMAMFVNKHQLTKQVLLESKLTLLADLLNMKEQFVSAEWNIGVNVALTQRMRVKLLMDLKYDPKVMFDKTLSDGTIEKVRRIQLRESIFLNFVYNLSN